MFWKKNPKPVGYKEVAMDLKQAANTVLMDFSIVGISGPELITLYSLISYIDTFVLKCLKDDKLTNKYWILARLLEARVVLKASTSPDIQRIVTKLDALESMILQGKKEDGKKVNKNSGGDRPTSDGA